VARFARIGSSFRSGVSKTNAAMQSGDIGAMASAIDIAPRDSIMARRLALSGKRRRRLVA